MSTASTESEHQLELAGWVQGAEAVTGRAPQPPGERGDGYPVRVQASSESCGSQGAVRSAVTWGPRDALIFASRRGSVMVSARSRGQLSVPRTMTLMPGRSTMDPVPPVVTRWLGRAMNHVGALARGESLTHEVAAGVHTVQATRDDKHTSPRRKVTLADEEHLTLYASLISERADYVPVRETSSGGSSGTAQVTAHLGKRRTRLEADAGAVSVRLTGTKSLSVSPASRGPNLSPIHTPTYKITAITAVSRRDDDYAAPALCLFYPCWVRDCASWVAAATSRRAPAVADPLGGEHP